MDRSTKKGAIQLGKPNWTHKFNWGIKNVELINNLERIELN